MSGRAALGALAAVMLVAPGCGSAGAAPRRVELTARWSAWSRSVVEVPVGVPVRFVLRNEDPIDHEFILGDREVQVRHERGTEPRHDQRPTEVSLRPQRTTVTVVTFDRPGRLYFACHLPGHYAYGMHGVLDVR